MNNKYEDNYPQHDKTHEPYCHNEAEDDVDESQSVNAFDDLAWSDAWFPALYDSEAGNLPDEEVDERLE